MTPIPHDSIKVSVHYIAATKPHKVDATSATLLSDIKAGALTAFGLVEDANKIYKMFAHKSELANLNLTVGSAADGKPELQIDLEEFIIQGK